MKVKIRSRRKTNQKPKDAKSGPEDTNYMEALDDIQPVADFKPEIKVVLYGKPASGKTTLASTFPKPILVLDISEKGTDSIRDVDGVFVKRCKTLLDLELIYWALRKKAAVAPKGSGKWSGKPFATVVIDTISQVQNFAITAYQESEGDGPVMENAIGNFGRMTKQGWGIVGGKMKEVITNYRDLSINVIFIAHERAFEPEETEDDDAPKIDPSVGPALMPSVAQTLNAAVGIIGNTFIREKIKRIKMPKGQPDKEKRMIRYCLRIGPHAYYTTKIRKPRSQELPAVIDDPSYEALREYIVGE